MSELQATIEFSVELGKFYNVDLFQRGFYQIRTSLKASPKQPSKVEISLPKPSDGKFSQATILNGVAVSKTFQILYRNEDVAISELMLFRFHTLVDSTKAVPGPLFPRIEESLENLDIQIALELWFCDEDLSEQMQEKMECVSQRTLQLHFNPSKGLHHQIPVLFDYFHLCSVEVVIHGSLIAIHQPYISVPKQPKSAWTNKSPELSTLEEVYFGVGAIESGFNQLPRTLRACQVHRYLCNILLSAYESLQSTFEHYLSDLLNSGYKLDHVDCHDRLTNMVSILQNFEDEEDLIQTALTDMTQLCAENVILWNQFIDVVSLNEKINLHLAKDHHNSRVKRFAEGFFTEEHPKTGCLECFDPSLHGHNDEANTVRNSLYFQNLQPLSVECLDLDGDHMSLPIVFEDVYYDQHSSDVMRTPKSRPRFGRTGSGKKSDKRLSSGSKKSSDQSLFQNRSKKYIIKNVKPDALKRPSSVVLEHETVKLGGSDCSLVGYRKMTENTFVPQSPIELGTLSPVQSSTQCCPQSALASSLSMPSLLPHACMRRGSSNSLTELEINDGTLSRLKGLEHTSSDPALAMHEDKKPKAARSLTAPVAEYFPNGYELNSLDKNSSDGSENSFVNAGHSGQSNCQNPICDSCGDVMDKLVHEFDHLPSSISSYCDNCRTKHSHNSNGISKLDGKPSTDSSMGDSNKNGVLNTDNSQNVSVPTKDKDRHSSFVSNSAISMQNNADNDKNITDLTLESIEISSLASDKRDSAYMSESANTSTANLSTISVSKESGIQEGADSVSLASENQGEDKLTIIELLKEEYKKLHDIVPDSPKRLPNRSVSVDKPSHHTSTSSNSSSNSSQTVQSGDKDGIVRYQLVSIVGQQTVNFVKLRERLKIDLKYDGYLYSEKAQLASTIPYFQIPRYIQDSDEGVHLIVCLHGLDGNSADLRLIRTYVEMALPGHRIEFLMSERNQQDTFAGFDVMTDRLVTEILSYIELYSMQVGKISFVGHSLGNIIIRSALTRPKLAHLLPKLHTYLSLSGPHLGTLYNNSGLVNMGMWFMQKWKKSGSLLQLSLKDNPDPRQCFLYKLSEKPGLDLFRNVLLVGSVQDRYVPYHSSRIEMCRAALKDNSGFGSVYAEMVRNLLKPVVDNKNCKLVRYDVYHALQNTANTIIGRAAHIAVLDSEIFIEKFMTVAALQYFK